MDVVVLLVTPTSDFIEQISTTGTWPLFYCLLLFHGRDLRFKLFNLHTPQFIMPHGFLHSKSAFTIFNRYYEK